MADNKKQLLDEGSVRHFMKIAGTGKLTDDFVKKTGLLKEESTGRGKIFDPHGDDPRHDNLNEEDVTEEGKDVAEEGKDLEEEVQEEGEVQEEAVGSIVAKGPGKAIESGKGMSGSGKKPTAKMQYEGKGSLTPKGPGKGIESGKGMSGSGKKPTAKVQYEAEVAEEGEQLQEMGASLGGDEEVGGPPVDEPAMGGEPDGDEPVGGAGDLTGLVQAIADAISQHTGVNVSVEGGEGGGEEMGEPGQEPDMDEVPPGSGDNVALQQETGMVGYKTEDPKARKMPSGQMQEAKKVGAKAPVKTPSKKEQSQQLVEAITKKVLARLSDAAKKKVATGKQQGKAPVKK